MSDPAPRVKEALQEFDRALEAYRQAFEAWIASEGQDTQTRRRLLEEADRLLDEARRRLAAVDHELPA